jgi:predicted deacetylase
MACAEARLLCVSIHDVAPATWPRCIRLIDAVRAVAPVPLSLLVVPDYHGDSAPERDQLFVDALKHRVACGDELVLHGYRHVDEAPAPTTPLAFLQRRFFTAGEGEFAALSCAEAERRIGLGLQWFAASALPTRGFVAPAWLLGRGAWQALRHSGFDYTATRTRLHLLPERQAIAFPALTYSTRSAWRRAASFLYNEARSVGCAGAQVLRIALHPADAGHAAVVRHWQRLIAHHLEGRRAVTKLQVAAWARSHIAVSEGAG